EVLSRMASTSEQSLYIVSYPEALAEKVVSKNELSANTIPVLKGSSLDFKQLEERLDELGFVRVEYVYEPGQYALRGSIVDIYSFSSEMPYRLDFFGDEVESIRTFDVQTQLSEGFVDEMVVVPEITKAEFDYIPVMDFLPEDTVLVTKNLAYVCDRVEQTYREGYAVQAVLEDQALNLPEYERDDMLGGFGKSFHQKVVEPEVFHRGIAKMKRIDLGGRGEKEGSSIDFDISAQPLFHKNFDLLTQECYRFLDDGYKIFILADSQKQIERLKDIFASLERPIPFEPVQRTIHEGFVDNSLKICFFTDHQIFDRFHKYNLKSDKARKGKVALTLKEIQQFEIGDYVVHIDHGVGRFMGLVRVPNGDSFQEMIKISYQNEDTVYVSIHALHKISKYKGKEGEPPRISKLGTGAWERMKERVKTKVKDIARDLIKLYAARLQEKGFAFSPDSYLQQELEASFLYEDTPDQLKATQEVKADMERQQPMDRLVCGDVGFGKTEVAVRAAFKAAVDGKQTAVLVPTTVLAYQHFQTFSNRLKEFPVRVDYLSRARTTKQQSAIFKDLADGKIDIIIGTHKLVGKQVKFKDLGLLVIDEEQKFGV
ncbi:MAG: DEAD/DEAH box helicase, partial [Bacteroidaceae bacterium]|nr:DEAD/DEAH box helicase [Bacteroidaceae bacterium]